MAVCRQCASGLNARGRMYCSNACQRQFEYELYIQRWKAGEVDGSRGIRTKGFSGHIVKYLRQRSGNACALCGWGKVNSVTNRVPLEIDHIDGKSQNNTEANLRLICPNCHALSPTFRNLNKGNGRSWRRDKYVKVTPP